MMVPLRVVSGEALSRIIVKPAMVIMTIMIGHPHAHLVVLCVAAEIGEATAP
jgi:hypothetical protein